MSENKDYTPMNDLLERIDETIDNGATVPFSNKKMIDGDRIHELVDEVRMSIPPEIKRAQELEVQRKVILEAAKKEADEIRNSALSEKEAVMKDAKAEADKLVSQEAIIARAEQYVKEQVDRANQDAEDIVSRARAEAENIIADANNRKQSIMDAMVANINATLGDASETLQADVNRLTKSLEDVNRMREAILRLSEQ
ncbi:MULTISPECIES: hypothetical protein [Ruminococcus]|uniref:ATPase n=1 Tax=Ruminococcus albus (strain ATCC 27210 / DSM 20455 / JCM 14654 / NCDO 2250 / 7) TaxID=697329 RepID=E6UKF3_RUMA7|nr:MULTISPECIES: hypothetical protein [Ruminococcus]ADU24149.1 hypothetical protein Rumal_3712 [Ruminococcus albus 7 = DSM 20455]MCR5021257.1 hypothetical protein [Ruminococcus sp.]